MKKVAILYSAYKPVIDAIIAENSDCQIECFDRLQSGHEKYDLIVSVGFDSKETDLPNVLTSHYSLLPAFDCDEPVKQAILSGVKVTGISFYYTKPKRIVAQYPIFITNSSHFDDVENELIYLEQTLFPIIIKKILNNEVFELKELLKQNKCNGNCEGCRGCNH